MKATGAEDPLPAAAPPGTAWDAGAIDTDASTNSVISAPTAVAFRRLAAGCSRTTATTPPNALRARSQPSATLSCDAGSAGPHPRLASCRSLRNAALR